MALRGYFRDCALAYFPNLSHVRTCTENSIWMAHVINWRGFSAPEVICLEVPTTLTPEGSLSQHICNPLVPTLMGSYAGRSFTWLYLATQEEGSLLLQCPLVGTNDWKSSTIREASNIIWESKKPFLWGSVISKTHALRPVRENRCPKPYFYPMQNCLVLMPFYNPRGQPVNSMTWTNPTWIKKEERSTRNSWVCVLRWWTSTDQYVQGTVNCWKWNRTQSIRLATTD